MQEFCCVKIRALTRLGNRNGGEQADDGHDNHDFNQCESGTACGFGLRADISRQPVNFHMRLINPILKLSTTPQGSNNGGGGVCPKQPYPGFIVDASARKNCWSAVGRVAVWSFHIEQGAPARASTVRPGRTLFRRKIHQD